MTHLNQFIDVAIIAALSHERFSAHYECRRAATCANQKDSERAKQADFLSLDAVRVFLSSLALFQEIQQFPFHPIYWKCKSHSMQHSVLPNHVLFNINNLI